MIVIYTWPTLSRRELYSTWSLCLIQLSLIMTSPTGRVPILHLFLYSRYAYSNFVFFLKVNIKIISYFYLKNSCRRSNKKWTRSWVRQFSITVLSRMTSGQLLRLRSNQTSVRYIRKSCLFWPSPLIDARKKKLFTGAWSEGFTWLTLVLFRTNSRVNCSWQI